MKFRPEWVRRPALKVFYGRGVMSSSASQTASIAGLESDPSLYPTNCLSTAVS